MAGSDWTSGLCTSCTDSSWRCPFLFNITSSLALALWSKPALKNAFTITLTISLLSRANQPLNPTKDRVLHWLLRDGEGSPSRLLDHEEREGRPIQTRMSRALTGT